MHYEFVLSDHHVPDHDVRVISIQKQLLKDIRPKVVWHLGDHWDLEGASRFLKHPQAELNLQTEIDKGVEVLAELRSAAPRAKWVFVCGNHEERIKKLIWTYRQFASMKCLQLPELLKLDRLKVEFIPEGVVVRDRVMFRHGGIIRSAAGASAVAQLESNWVCGFSGDTHRLAQIHKRTKAGEYWWIETGCGQHYDPAWMKGKTSNWQHGAAYLVRSPKGLYAGIIPITEQGALWNGQIYSRGSRKSVTV